MNNEPLSLLGAWRTHDHARGTSRGVQAGGDRAAGGRRPSGRYRIDDQRSQKGGRAALNAALLRALLAHALYFRNTPDQVRDWIDGFN